MLLVREWKEILMPVTRGRRRGLQRVGKEHSFEFCHAPSHESRKDSARDHSIRSDTPVRGSWLLPGEAHFSWTGFLFIFFKEKIFLHWYKFLPPCHSYLRVLKLLWGSTRHSLVDRPSNTHTSGWKCGAHFQICWDPTGWPPMLSSRTPHHSEDP